MLGQGPKSQRKAWDVSVYKKVWPNENYYITTMSMLIVQTTMKL